MIAFPNAKINLGLQIIKRRPDNYHDLETVFYPIAVHDVLEIVEASETKLFVSGIHIPRYSENLCIKVYDLLKTSYKLPPIHIYLHKNIPLGAGLGGGSADAAFLIKLINDYFSLNLSRADMEGFARMVGADCAFFINNKPAFATGIGDKFAAIEIDLTSYHFVIIKPDIHISTAEAFNGLVPNENGHNLKERILQPINTWRETIFNDFESSIFVKYPKIEKIKEELYLSGAIYASLSGSGSSVFGIFEKPIFLPELEKSNNIFYC